MVSPVRSATGSFDQGVIWLSRLFSDQVYPLPSTAAWKPKLRLATTLIQGAGVDLPAPNVVTYSRPSRANHPSPLEHSSCGGDVDGCCACVDGGRGGGGAPPAKGSLT